MEENTAGNLQWVRSLLAEWQLLADASFSDLVLWVPKRTKLHVYAHARPSTAAKSPRGAYRDACSTLGVVPEATIIRKRGSDGVGLSGFGLGDVSVERRTRATRSLGTRRLSSPAFSADASQYTEGRCA